MQNFLNFVIVKLVLKLCSHNYLLCLDFLSIKSLIFAPLNTFPKYLLNLLQNSRFGYKNRENDFDRNLFLKSLQHDLHYGMYIEIKYMAQDLIYFTANIVGFKKTFNIYEKFDLEVFHLNSKLTYGKIHFDFSRLV